ncbi:hypothetical protein QLX52_20655 [Streptomyces albus]|nr:hypothetical protein [Streptomyces albus]MDI6411227.1 hypothetical protein [Streptomyces albus]
MGRTAVVVTGGAWWCLVHWWCWCADGAGGAGGAGGAVLMVLVVLVVPV